MCKLCKVEGDFSEIARQGSGSACRSIYGGFVQWHMGAAESGEDSIASVVKEAEHWSDLRILILVVSLHIKMRGVNFKRNFGISKHFLFLRTGSDKMIYFLGKYSFSLGLIM